MWLQKGARAGRTSRPSTAQQEANSFPLIEGTTYSRKPDMVLKASAAYKLPGDNYERFLVYKIPFELPDSASIEAVEFFCDNKKIIHHVNYAVHEVPPGIDINSGPEFINLTEDDRTKYDAYLPFKKSITYYGGWIPGASFESYPKGIGWVMPKRGVMLLTVHYAPSAKEEVSISGVNFFYSKTPVERRIKVISFGSGGIGEEQIRPPLLIPPNVVRTYNLDIRNPSEDFSAMYVWPHMHYIGKTFLAYGLTPLGDTIRLTSVPQWDFRWQEIYKFKNLVRIPKGTTVHIEGTFDNTAGNPFNPNSPPQFVFSSGDMRSKDEMLTLLLIFLPYKEGDEKLSLIP
ncbi:MAG: cytochrome c [Verrucomicrobiaceae bacterium]|nr:MAG: cytochrome c [Verrucomicrobiaceae bacterium]